jgi:hypothetical protein
VEELESAAEERDVGHVFREPVRLLQPLFNYTQTTRSSLRLAAPFGDRTAGVLNLIPTQAEDGKLPFQLYTRRASDRFGRSLEAIAASLPDGVEPWEYAPGVDEWWQGHSGWLRSSGDCRPLRDALTGESEGG